MCVGVFSKLLLSSVITWWPDGSQRFCFWSAHIYWLSRSYSKWTRSRLTFTIGFFCGLSYTAQWFIIGILFVAVCVLHAGRWLYFTYTFSCDTAVPLRLAMKHTQTQWIHTVSLMPLKGFFSCLLFPHRASSPFNCSCADSSGEIESGQWD